MGVLWPETSNFSHCIQTSFHLTAVVGVHLLRRDKHNKHTTFILKDAGILFALSGCQRREPSSHSCRC